MNVNNSERIALRTQLLRRWTPDTLVSDVQHALFAYLPDKPDKDRRRWHPVQRSDISHLLPNPCHRRAAAPRLAIHAVLTSKAKVTYYVLLACNGYASCHWTMSIRPYENSTLAFPGWQLTK